jgi:hypothetical protein
VGNDLVGCESHQTVVNTHAGSYNHPHELRILQISSTQGFVTLGT